MASSAASTSTLPDQGEATATSQAGPLPVKFAEIGYREPEADLERGLNAEEHESVESLQLPARHPDDRESTTEIPLTPAVATAGQVDESASTSPSTRKRRNKQYKILGGVKLLTFTLFATQVLALAGTIIGWVFSLKLFQNMAQKSDMNGSMAQGSVFIWVVFILLTLTGEPTALSHIKHVPHQTGNRRRNIP